MGPSVLGGAGGAAARTWRGRGRVLPFHLCILESSTVGDIDKPDLHVLSFALSLRSTAGPCARANKLERPPPPQPRSARARDLLAPTDAPAGGTIRNSACIKGSAGFFFFFLEQHGPSKKKKLVKAYGTNLAANSARAQHPLRREPRCQQRRAAAAALVVRCCGITRGVPDAG